MSLQQNGGQQGIPRNLGTNPYMIPYVEKWAAESFFSRKYSRRAHRDPPKFIFFIKTNKWGKWWSWWLRITNAFILCNLLWKVQKSLAVNREGIFNVKVWLTWLKFRCTLDKKKKNEHTFNIIISIYIPAKPLHNHDIVSVHFNNFYCMEICDKLSRD